METKLCQERYMTDEIEYILTNDERNCIIKGPPGVGKTSGLANYLKKLNNDKSILILSPRITLTHQLKNSFKDVKGMTSYKEVYSKHVQDKGVNRFIVSPESLHRFSQVDENGRTIMENPDLIIIDEAVAFLENLFSPTLNKYRTLVIETLKILFKSEDTRVILMDAYFKKEHLGLYARLIDDQLGATLDENWVYLINRWVPDTDITLTSDYNGFKKLFTEDVQKEGLTILASSSKDRAVFFYDLITDKLGIVESDDVLLITGESKDDLKATARFASQEWSKYSVIIYTPVVYVGVDFSKEAKVFVFCDSHTVLPHGLVQMAGRCRNPSSVRYYIQRIHKITEYIDYESNISDIYSDYKTYGEMCHFRPTRQGNTIVMTPIDDFYTTLWIYFKKKQTEFRNNPYNSLSTFLHKNFTMLKTDSLTSPLVKVKDVVEEINEDISSNSMEIYVGEKTVNDVDQGDDTASRMTIDNLQHEKHKIDEIIEFLDCPTINLTNEQIKHVASYDIETLRRFNNLTEPFKEVVTKELLKKQKQKFMTDLELLRTARFWFVLSICCSNHHITLTAENTINNFVDLELNNTTIGDKWDKVKELMTDFRYMFIGKYLKGFKPLTDNQLKDNRTMHTNFLRRFCIMVEKDFGFKIIKTKEVRKVVRGTRQRFYTYAIDPDSYFNLYSLYIIKYKKEQSYNRLKVSNNYNYVNENLKEILSVIFI